MKKAYGNCETIWKDKIYALMDSQKEKREKETESLFKKIIAENLDMSPQNFNSKCYSLRQIVTKLFKNKGKNNFKNSKRKKILSDKRAEKFNNEMEKAIESKWVGRQKDRMS